MAQAIDILKQRSAEATRLAADQDRLKAGIGCRAAGRHAQTRRRVRGFGQERGRRHGIVCDRHEDVGQFHEPGGGDDQRRDDGGSRCRRRDQYQCRHGCGGDRGAFIL